MARLVIVDDSPMVRKAVKGMLSRDLPGLEVCGEAADSEEGLRKWTDLKPDIVLIDLSLPGENGLTLANKLRKTFPDAKIVIMSEQDPGTLAQLENSSGFVCVAKSRLVVDLVPALERLLLLQ